MSCPTTSSRADVADLPEEFAPHADYLRGRFMLVQEGRGLPGRVHRARLSRRLGLEGVPGATARSAASSFPAGLRESDKLDEPIFTPSTKAEIGDHDENISFERMVEIIGETACRGSSRDVSIALYSQRARARCRHAASSSPTPSSSSASIDGEVTLIDEVLTPDSSRFWPADEYEPGRGQASFDKQYVRDWLESERLGQDAAAARAARRRSSRARASATSRPTSTITGRTFEPEGRPEPHGTTQCTEPALSEGRRGRARRARARPAPSPSATSGDTGSCRSGKGASRRRARFLQPLPDAGHAGVQALAQDLARPARRGASSSRSAPGAAQTTRQLGHASALVAAYTMHLRGGLHRRHQDPPDAQGVRGRARQGRAARRRQFRGVRRRMRRREVAETDREGDA